MSEQRRTQSSHEAESMPAESTWQDIQKKRDEAVEHARKSDESWEHHGGTQLEALSVKLQVAEEVDKPLLEEQLEQAKWSFYHSMMAATPDGEAHPDVSRELRDGFIEFAQETRTKDRAEADQAEDAWVALGGDTLDKAEAMQEAIRARGAKAGEDAAYQRAIINVGNAKNQVSAKWQELYGDTNAAHEEDSSSEHAHAAGKLGAHAASTSGSIGSSSRRRKSSEDHSTSRDGASSNADSNTRSRNKAKTSLGEEMPLVATEAEAQQLMEAQIETYKQRGHTDASWEALQYSIGQYEAIRNDRLKREINKSIDDAYHAAAEASDSSDAENEPTDGQVSAEATSSTAGNMAAETEVVEAQTADPADAAEPTGMRTGKVFTRAKRMSRRLRNRFNKAKRTRAQNTTRARQASAEADQSEYAEFSDKADAEQGSLGDLVRISRRSDRYENDENDSGNAKAA